MAVARFVSLVTIAVAGPFPGDTWRWEIDGPARYQAGDEATEAEAWAAARAAAWGVLGRLEVPGGVDELRRAINGEGT